MSLKNGEGGSVKVAVTIVEGDNDGVRGKGGFFFESFEDSQDVDGMVVMRGEVVHLLAEISGSDGETGTDSVMRIGIGANVMIHQDRDAQGRPRSGSIGGGFLGLVASLGFENIVASLGALVL